MFEHTDQNNVAMSCLGHEYVVSNTLIQAPTNRLPGARGLPEKSPGQTTF